MEFPQLLFLPQKGGCWTLRVSAPRRITVGVYAQPGADPVCPWRCHQCNPDGAVEILGRWHQTEYTRAAGGYSEEL